jgi:hypothetical protein
MEAGQRGDMPGDDGVRLEPRLGEPFPGAPVTVEVLHRHLPQLDALRERGPGRRIGDGVEAEHLAAAEQPEQLGTGGGQR